MCTGGKSIRDVDLDYLNALTVYIELTEPTIAFESNACVKKTFFAHYYDALMEIENFKGNKGIGLFLLICGAVIVVLAVVLVIIRVMVLNKNEQTEETDDLII